MVVLKKYKNAQIPFVNTETKEVRYDPERCYETILKVIDSTGAEFTVYTQGYVKHSKGLRINNPNVGLIINNNFMKIGDYEYLLYRYGKLQSWALTKDLKELYKTMTKDLK